MIDGYCKEWNIYFFEKCKIFEKSRVGLDFVTILNWIYFFKLSFGTIAEHSHSKNSPLEFRVQTLDLDLDLTGTWTGNNYLLFSFSFFITQITVASRQKYLAQISLSILFSSFLCSDWLFLCKNTFIIPAQSSFQ